MSYHLPHCHTTLYLVILKALTEVSQKQKRDLVDSSLSAKAKNEKRRDRDFSLASLSQNDKIISELESKIDDLVYALCELTQDEIKIIEST